MRVNAVAGGCQSVGYCASWAGACCVCSLVIQVWFLFAWHAGQVTIFLTNLFAVGCMAKLRFFSETCKRSVCIFAFLRAKKDAGLSFSFIRQQYCIIYNL